MVLENSQSWSLLRELCSTAVAPSLSMGAVIRVRTIRSSLVLPTAKISSGKRASTYGIIQGQIIRKDPVSQANSLS